ncbi:MAG: hypothetical protein KJ666_14795 [Bacteroidetes bacterium]|nr:hypothetical protein [Bacteroidota bacterium]MBU2583752.1 hypothetical protein [Bacteroidota bacterium]
MVVQKVIRQGGLSDSLGPRLPHEIRMGGQGKDFLITLEDSSLRSE